MISLVGATVCVILSAGIGTTIGFISGYKQKKEIEKLFDDKIKEQKNENG